MKICHFTDVHLSPLGHVPQSRTDSYHSDVATELFELKQALIREKPDFIVYTGDLFHLKNQSAYSPRDMNYYESLLKDFPPFAAIPGNHDLPKSAYQNVKDSPYTTMCQMLPQTIRDISGKYADIPLMGDFRKIRIVGIPYVAAHSFREAVQNFLAGVNILDDSEPTMYGFLIHVDATPNKILVTLWDSFSYQELADIFPKNSILFMGHIHASFPPWRDPVRNVTISKPWSIGRVLKDYFNTCDILETQHKPSYSVTEIKTVAEGTLINMYYREIPCKAGSEIFVKESLQTQLEKSKEIQDFITSLKNSGTGSDIFFTSDPMTYLNGLNLQKEIFDTIQEYLK